jgi:hypothetical protein
MRDEHGTVCIDGTARAGTQEIFVLRYIQARDPALIGKPFFAAFDPAAAWLTDLKPAPGFPARPAVRTGLPAGTPQEALDTACTIHLTGPGHEPGP